MSYVSKIIEEMQEVVKSGQSVAAILPAAEAQSTHFWTTQDTFLNELEKFSSAWFKRRHEATKHAMEASKELTEKAFGNPAEAMTILSKWQSDMMEKLAEDAKDYMELVTSSTAAAVSNEVEAVQESAETVKRVTKTAKSEPV
ncbi:hypothetical protein E4Z66_08095 [Aliishimia ponticola]|uniref:Phasin domain-containing protein n=1 Tax=Aliishimia ponticola TaxID=2499833 RepID=A0A4V3XKG8_9RHOB|nr:hypothetical protein [Aliishimia ponticola]THH36893.1 hypothetical protein E4Z66_08095 [Aliishimia ponticola]